MADRPEHKAATLMTKLSTPLPTLDLAAETAWHWPQPPFARRLASPPLAIGEQPCRIETPAGATVEGLLVGFDANTGLMRVRMRAEGEALSLPFTKVRRLTLLTPWPIAPRMLGAPVERAPHVVHERGYRIELAAGGDFAGRTLGHVKQACGMFFFAPMDDAGVAQRVFVPAAVYRAVSFGRSAQEQAAERWITTPEQLIAALDAQRQAQIKPLGQALLDLGLLTRGQLERALSGQGQDRALPLGEALVAQGLIEAADLQTALAYKMGYPMVDLARFPLDKAVARKLPQTALIEYGAVPLLQLGDRLIAAIDDLSRVARLQDSHALIGLKLVPVLACRSRISLALASLPQRLGTDRWADNVSVDPGRRKGYGGLTGETIYGRLSTF